jgi:pimeloyl-ACP methyl ester carboxylesterase
VNTTADLALGHTFVDVAPGVRLHCAITGDGPLVLLLHGFPDFWYGWRLQIGAIAAAGFRVVAPDMRGYNLSDKPRGVGAYEVRTLVRDLAALVEKLGDGPASRAHVVAHDWGAAVAWSFAMAHPERLGRLAILNGPHPERMLSALRRRPAQMARSWYIFFFQLPWLPEQVLARASHDMLARTMRGDPTRRDAVTEADLAAYREAWSQPGALTAMLNWYRAIFRPGGGVRTRRALAPTLVLWGERDRYLGPELALPRHDLAPDMRVVWLPRASHWVQLDETERVNHELVAWLKA